MTGAISINIIIPNRSTTLSSRRSTYSLVILPVALQYLLQWHSQ